MVVGFGTVVSRADILSLTAKDGAGGWAAAASHTTRIKARITPCTNQ